jgi:hypothetical protein
MKARKINLENVLLITAVVTLVVVSVYNSITYGTYSSPW